MNYAFFPSWLKLGYATAFVCFLSITSIAQTPTKKAPRNDKPLVQLPNKAKTVQDKLQEASAFFADGIKAFALERYPDAIKLFQKAIELAPEQASFHYKLAESYLKANNLEGAISSGRQAINLDKNNKFYYNLLAKVYILQQKNAEAIEIYQNLIKNCPKTEEYYYEIAELQTKIGKWDDALESYNKLEQKYGINESLTRQKQKIYMHTKRNKKAIQEAEKLYQAAPMEPRYAVNLALLYTENKQIAQALAILEDQQKQGTADATAYITLAEIYKQQQKYKEALAYLKIAIQFPDLEADAKVNVMLDFMRNEQIINNPEMQKELTQVLALLPEQNPAHARSYVLYADVLLMQNQKLEANKRYYQSLQIDENNSDVWLRLLQLNEELALKDSTLKHAERAVNIFPNSAVFWLFHGVSLFHKKNYDKAVESLEEGRRLAYNNQDLQKEFLIRLGDSYQFLKNYAEADRCYEAVLKINPKEEYVLNNYSYYLAQRKEKLKQAQEMADKLLIINPDNVGYVDTYAWVLYAQQKYSQAKEVLERVIDKVTNGEIIEHYGDILFQLGEQEKAIEQWKKAQKLGNASANIAQKIMNKKLYE